MYLGMFGVLTGRVVSWFVGHVFWLLLLNICNTELMPGRLSCKNIQWNSRNFATIPKLNNVSTRKINLVLGIVCGTVRGFLFNVLPHLFTSRGCVCCSRIGKLGQPASCKHCRLGILLLKFRLIRKINKNL